MKFNMRYLDFKVGRNKYAILYLTNKEIFCIGPLDANVVTERVHIMFIFLQFLLLSIFYRMYCSRVLGVLLVARSEGRT